MLRKLSIWAIVIAANKDPGDRELAKFFFVIPGVDWLRELIQKI